MLIKFLKKYKYRIIAMIIFPFVCLTLLDLLLGDAMEQGKKELQAHIPAVMVYNSNIPLNEVLKPDARTPDFVTALQTFPLMTDKEGEVVKQCYTDNLLKLGWSESGYKAEINYRDDSHYYDRFIFAKGEYRLSLKIFPPLHENRKTSTLYTYEKPWYGISFAKKGVLK